MDLSAHAHMNVLSRGCASLLLVPWEGFRSTADWVLGGSQVTWTFDDILAPLLFKVNCISHVLDVTLRGLGSRTDSSLLFLTSLVQSRKEVMGTLS